jgi:RNA polymerase-binding transcription factor DksA
MNTNRQTPSAAKSRDVLPAPLAETYVPTTWRRHFHRLLTLREQLLNETDELARDMQQPTESFGLHMADAATDSFDRDLAYSLLSMEENALAEIDTALQRIREGRYGVCEKSGELIRRERLDAIPWTRYTAKVQTQLEAEGATPHAHLNPVASTGREQPPITE